MNEQPQSSRFDSLLRKLVAVPKKEVAEKEREYKNERKKLKKRRQSGK